MAEICKHYCDRCGAEINHSSFPQTKLVSIYEDYVLGCGPFDYESQEYELCKDCSKEFKSFLRCGKKADVDAD